MQPISPLITCEILQHCCAPSITSTQNNRRTNPTTNNPQNPGFNDGVRKFDSQVFGIISDYIFVCEKITIIDGTGIFLIFFFTINRATGCCIP